MIVNQTALNVQDIDFINGQLRKQGIVIAIRIIGFLLAVFWLFDASLCLYLQIKYHDQSVSDLIFMVLMYVLGIYTLYRVIFLKYASRRSSMKHRSLFVPRTYTLDADGAAVHHSYEGIDADNKFSFSNADCYFAGQTAVYLRFCAEGKKKYYMCLHDDGYTEGSRAELIALLEEKNVRRA